MARLQLSATALEDDPTGLPLWQQLNPAWPQEIRDFDNDHGTDMQDWLEQHGRRFREWEPLASKGILHTLDETFVEDQPEAEEGLATEWEVCSSWFQASD